MRFCNYPAKNIRSDDRELSRSDNGKSSRSGDNNSSRSHNAESSHSDDIKLAHSDDGFTSQTERQLDGPERHEVSHTFDSSLTRLSNVRSKRTASSRQPSALFQECFADVSDEHDCLPNATSALWLQNTSTSLVSSGVETPSLLRPVPRKSFLTQQLRTPSSATIGSFSTTSALIDEPILKFHHEHSAVFTDTPSSSTTLSSQLTDLSIQVQELPQSIDAFTSAFLNSLTFPAALVREHDGTLIHVNRPLCRTLGFHEHTLLRQTLSSLFPAEKSISTHDSLLKTFRMNMKHPKSKPRSNGWSRVVRARHVSGRTVMVELALSLVRSHTVNDEEYWLATMREMSPFEVTFRQSRFETEFEGSSFSY